MMVASLRPNRFTVDITAELAAHYPPTTKLSVLLVTYNHEKYVRQALEGVLMQEIDLDYEIVIADDGSTDGTREAIVAVLEEAGKTNYRFLDHSKNLGITKNYQRALYACNADYIAVLEGDDYWVHTKKLHIQLNYLHTHRECVGSSANYFVHVPEQGSFQPRVRIKPKWSSISARELIYDNVIGNFSTCMYRAKSLRTLPPKVFEGESYDWIINILLLRHGLFGFYNEPLSVYRVHLGGSWSRLSTVEQARSQINALERFNDLSEGVFAAEFDQLRKRLTRTYLSPKAQASARQLERQARIEAAGRSPSRTLSVILHMVYKTVPVGALRRILPDGLKGRITKAMGYR